MYAVYKTVIDSRMRKDTQEFLPITANQPRGSLISGVTHVKEMLLPMMNSVQFLCQEVSCTNFLPVCVISCAPSVGSPSVKGRRMGGNNIPALERICAQCEGKNGAFRNTRFLSGPCTYPL